MKLTCPKCRSLIPAARVNVATDVAVCEKCDEAYSVADLLAGGQVPEEFDINAPPPGAWYEETGDGWRVGATTRSCAAFFFIPFMCVWSGGSLGGIYGSQIITGEFNLVMSLFGIPFILGSLLLGVGCLMTVCGRVEVSVSGDEGRLFGGVGAIGWTRRFHWASITAVTTEVFVDSESRSGSKQITLVGPKRLKFGSMVSEARREFILNALRKALAERKS